MRTGRRLLSVGIALSIVAAVPATHAAAVNPPTQLSPAGDYVRLALTVSKQFHADLTDGVVANCATSTSSPTGSEANNQLPTTNNPTTSGPVKVTLNPFTYADCTSPAAGSVSVTASGQWGLSVQQVTTGALPLVRITIPQAGLVVHAPDVGCTGTFAPDGPVTLTGRWRNGSPARITVPDRTIPVRVTGSFVCLPSDYQGSVSFAYTVRDRTDRTADVTVS